MKIYEVGGCVRDALMGVEPKDRDYVVVGSTPEEMISLGFQQVGAAFPVFLHPETKEEYALARTERKVGNGYNGFECVFSPDVTLEEDLGRRDLTINSIARDIETGEIIDPFGGCADIELKVLRHTSDAFVDDPLRVLRLARFLARMPGFYIQPATSSLVWDLVHSGEMNFISAERYWAELMKVFSDDTTNIAEFFLCLHNFGVLRATNYFVQLLGSFDKDDSDDEFYEICGRIRSRIKKPELKAAVFVALFGNGMPDDLRALPKRVTTLVNNFRMVNVCDLGNAVDLYDIFAATRSLNENTPALMDLACCMRFTDWRKESNILLSAMAKCHSVKSDPYKHLSGIEIGAAMKKERLYLIQSVINK